jgi:molybdopterin-guanine dinucleotide biosynthesis protein A
MRSAVILAGGNSLRLGAEKSLLEFEDRPLICWTLETLFQAADEVIIVARDERHAGRLEKIISGTKSDTGLEPSPKAVFTWDRIPGFGPVAGLEAGMSRARGKFVFATGCDLPFLKLEVINRLYELADAMDGYDAAVPVHPNGFFEPLHSVYCVEKMQSACRRALEKGERRIHIPLQELRANRVAIDLLRPLDPELFSFFNLNTRVDLERARALWPDHRRKGFLRGSSVAFQNQINYVDNHYE